MSSLPPYSTYRTDNKQMMFPQATSHGNILTFTPPGFKQSLNVKFPDSRLAVCEKCKKNFKTRDMCRVRNTHTTAPWTTAYICVTLHESCTDADGKYIDQPLTVRMVQWQPFSVRKPFDPKTPVCSACKKTNRTRSFCRERHKHRHLPWCTVYVLLSALDAADPSTVVADPSKPLDGDGIEGIGDGDSGDAVGTAMKQEGTSALASETEQKPSENLAGITANIKPDGEKKAGSDDCDDIDDIAESRTFLAKVDCKATTIHWLELAEYEGDSGGVLPSGQSDPSYAMGQQPVQPADPNQAHYYQHAMGYAAQQHQNALKSQQQYFFHMQQRQQQHYAAHHAAWQAHYNHPHQMPMHGQQSQPPTPPAGSTPIGDGATSPSPITAGEPSSQTKRGRPEEGSEQSPPPPPPQNSHGQQPTGQPQHGQQQQWMLYQQMYQSQLPPMGHPPHYPQRMGQSPEAVPPTGGAMMPSNDQQYNAPSTPDGNGKSNHESDLKRPRIV